MKLNRATPRTQSALLEVMEEHQVTTDGISRPVPDPFFVIATQNPVEYQGTFPLPRSADGPLLPCFSLVWVTPSENEELRMIQKLGGDKGNYSSLQPCISLDEVMAIRAECAQVKLEASLEQYLLDLVRATRSHPDITLGVSPRGTVAFLPGNSGACLHRRAKLCHS